MKKLSILLFVACIIPNFLHAQEPLALDTVLQAPNMGKEQIYKVAKQWFVDNMNDASRVIQLDDEKDCIIMGKYNIPFEVKSLTYAGLNGYLKNTIKIQARDGRYRLQIYDVTHYGQAQYNSGWNQGPVYMSAPEGWSRLKKKAYNVMLKTAIPTFQSSCAYTISSLQKAMGEADNLSEDDDW